MTSAEKTHSIATSADIRSSATTGITNACSGRSFVEPLKSTNGSCTSEAVVYGATGLLAAMGRLRPDADRSMAAHSASSASDRARPVAAIRQRRHGVIRASTPHESMDIHGSCLPGPSSAFADGLGWCQRPISTGTWTSAVENAESRSPSISRD